MTDEEIQKLAAAVVDAALARFAQGVVAPVPAANQEPRYMKVSDFAKSSGFSRSTIQTYITQGMPAVRIGKRGHRVDVEAAREWLRLGGAAA